MKPIRINNRDARRHVTSLTPFMGSNLFSVAYDDLYVVYSYGPHFPIYIHSGISRCWYANRDKWSLTTSRHQSLTRPFVADSDAVWLSTEAMKVLAKDGFTALVAKRLDGARWSDSYR